MAQKAQKQRDGSRSVGLLAHDLKIRLAANPVTARHLQMRQLAKAAKAMNIEITSGMTASKLAEIIRRQRRLETLQASGAKSEANSE